MRFRRAYVAAMCGGDKDRATRVSSLTNEEPLVVVKARVDIVWKVIRENGGDSRYGVVGKGEASLCRGGCRSAFEGAFGAEDGNVGCDRGVGSGRSSSFIYMVTKSVGCSSVGRTLRRCAEGIKIVRRGCRPWPMRNHWWL